MPSPFPGMDPYLEVPWKFPTLHASLITYVMEGLQPDLPGDYYAAVERRAWIEADERHVQPDVHVTETDGPSFDAGGGTAVAVAEPETAVADEPLHIRLLDEPFRQTFLEIRLGPGRDAKLVTVIEVLSPTNKRDSEGRRQYAAKQKEVIGSGVALVEIDLLRAGRHVTAVPEGYLPAKNVDFEYHVCVHRPAKFDEFEVYPTRIEDRLPRVAVPLLPRDGDVVLDLQKAFDRAYDAGPYRKEVDYAAEPPDPPLDTDRLTAIREARTKRKEVS